MSRRTAQSFSSFHSSFDISQIVVLLIVLLGAVCAGHAQAGPGFPAFSAYDCHEVDCVDLSNGNISLNAPVMSKNGTIPFHFALGANSYMYTYPIGASTYWAASMAPGTGSAFGASPSRLSVNYSTLGQTTCSGVLSSTESGFYVQTNDGTIHYLPPSLSTIDNPNCPTNFTATTIDGSGITLTVTNGNVTNVVDRAGDTLLYTNAFTDSNGNSISLSCVSACVWTDSMGLTVMTSTGTSSAPAYSWTNAGGGSPSVSITTSPETVKTVFGCTKIIDISPTALSLATGMSFTDGTSLSFGYEPTLGYAPDITGRIASITLRGGGYVYYRYSGTNNGVNCTYLTPPTIKRITGDGTTQYSFAPTSTGMTTTVTDDGGNVTIYTFVNSSTLTGNPAVGNPILTEVQHYQGASTLLTTDVYCYNAASGQPSNCPTASSSLPITERDVYHTISGMSTSSRTQIKYDSYGDVTYSAAYDFGGTTPVRATTTTYGTCTASCNTSSPTISAVGSNIKNKTGTVVITQNGSAIAQANYSYSTHGNLTSTSVWTGSSWLGQTSLNTYNSNGTPLKTFDFANHETDYAYTGTYTDCGSCTQFPFPTSVKDIGTGLTIQAAWEGYGAVKTSSTDPSGGVTQYGHGSDPFSRVTSIEDALEQNTIYGTYPMGSSPDTVNSSFTFNSGNSIHNTTQTTDGYGRTLNTQTQQGPSSGNYDTVSSTYQWNGNYFSVATSQPCSAGLNGTGINCILYHAVYYDALGRLYEATTSYNETLQHTYTQNDDLAVLGPAPTGDGENTKQVQKQYDGLGRLQYSCMIGNGSSTACAQNTGSQNGVTDAYTYTQGTGYTITTVQRGGSSGQKRSITYDALGRVTQKISPEAGTRNYYYDSVSTPGCPSGYTGSIGKLEASKDLNGNLICYAYDSLGRVTGINANGTTCRHFHYDTTYSSVPSGVTTPANTLGRLAEASTDNCSGTLSTDEWFSYDKDGNQTDLWETTLNAGRYYHSTATFAGNGAVLTLDLKNPSEYTNTYTLDGEGRWTSLVNSHVPQTQVSSVAYNAASQPTQVNIGSGTDNDAYTYDPDTGRMTQYVFTVGSANETGVLTWNPIGSLKTLAITDGFHSGGTQTCNMGSSTPSMGYDDQNRLLMFDCGTSGWGQTFGYDQYDNLTKTKIPADNVGSTFNPTYNSSNNQYQSGYGASYDSDGNQTYDPSNMNTYTWNAWSKLASVDMSGTGCSTSGECIIYDAFGRIVEVDSGTTYTETFYTQAGKGIFHGAAKVTGLWPAPGAGIVGDSTAFIHQDWMGNVRLGHTISTSRVTFDQALTPYGEIYATSGTASYGENNFTGDVQSIVSGTSGLWDTPNRELGTVPARWLSPDPAQSGWNPYAYVTNPNTNSDPSGLGNCGNYSGPCYNYGVEGSTSCPGGCVGGIGGPLPYGGDGYWSTDSIAEANAFYADGFGGAYSANGMGWAGDVSAAAEGASTSGSSDSATCAANTCITVSCGGTFAQIDCDPPTQAVEGSQWLSIYTSLGLQHGLTLLSQYQADPMSSFGKDVLQQLGPASSAAEEFIIQGYASSVIAATGVGLVEASITAGASDSTLFGTAYYGSKGVLNGGAPWGSIIRIGGSYSAEDGTLYFSIHGGVAPDVWHWDLFEWWP
jgi:hypothetical protein